MAESQIPQCERGGYKESNFAFPENGHVFSFPLGSQQAPTKERRGRGKLSC